MGRWRSFLQVFTSDHALKLDWIPDWVAIIGSGYIGLEFSDVYTALGSEVTFIEVQQPSPSSHVTQQLLQHHIWLLTHLSDGCIQAMDNLMPGFDKEIARLAQRTLINPRKIDWHTGVLASKVTPGKHQHQQTLISFLCQCP